MWIFIEIYSRFETQFFYTRADGRPHLEKVMVLIAEQWYDFPLALSNFCEHYFQKLFSIFFYTIFDNKNSKF
jgi:hypothetical protein